MNLVRVVLVPVAIGVVGAMLDGKGLGKCFFMGMACYTLGQLVMVV